MSERVDGSLSRKAQAIDDTALVVCQENPQATTGERWVLRRKGVPEVELGDRFGRAANALRAWMHAERAKGR